MKNENTWKLICNSDQFETDVTEFDIISAAIILFAKALKYDYGQGESIKDIPLYGKLINLRTKDAYDVDASGEIIVSTEYAVDKVRYTETEPWTPDPGDHPDQLQLSL